MIKALIFLIIFLDISTKALAYKYLQDVNTYPIIENVFHLTYVENRGAAFGILEDNRFMFISITILVSSVIIYYLEKKDISIKIFNLGLNLVLAGAIGNLIDRILLGYVIDFFDFRIWPVFNIADISIVIGAGLLILSIFKYGDTLEKEL